MKATKAATATTTSEQAVSEAAAIARCNRALAKEGRCGERLRKTRGERWRGDLGDYFVVDLDSNVVVARNIQDLDAFARELGVLRPGERIAEGA